METTKKPPEVLDAAAHVRLLEEENKRLRSFVEIGKILNAERNVQRLIPPVMSEIRKCLDADRASLFLVNLSRGEISTSYGEGLNDQTIRIHLKMGIAGLCVLTERLINVMEASDNLFFHKEIDEKTGYYTQSMLCAPFLNPRGEVEGAIQLLNKKIGLFSKEDEVEIVRACSMLTEMAARAEITAEAAKQLLDDLRSRVNCERGTVFLLNRQEMVLRSLVAEGLPDSSIELNLKLGIAGYVAVTGEEVIIQDAYSDPRFDRRADIESGYQTKTMLCLPIKNQTGEILGVIQVLNKKDGLFTEDDVSLLRALAPQIAIAIENAILFEEQNLQWRSILEVLAASIDAKDPLTAGHSERVAQYACGIADELGLGENEKDVLYVSALLHDYGKIGVSDAVLKKPGKLTPEEFEHIKEHIPATRDILGRMRFMQKYRRVPLIASCHHERLDSTGYSLGLKSQEIPFMSKILAVADVFEALTADRHYRQALPAEEAFAILEKDSGSKYDPNIIAAMRNYWKKRSG